MTGSIFIDKKHCMLVGVHPFHPLTGSATAGDNYKYIFFLIKIRNHPKS